MLKNRIWCRFCHPLAESDSRKCLPGQELSCNSPSNPDTHADSPRRSRLDIGLPSNPDFTPDRGGLEISSRRDCSRSEGTHRAACARGQRRAACVLGDSLSRANGWCGEAPLQGCGESICVDGLLFTTINALRHCLFEYVRTLDRHRWSVLAESIRKQDSG